MSFTTELILGGIGVVSSLLSVVLSVFLTFLAQNMQNEKLCLDKRLKQIESNMCQIENQAVQSQGQHQTLSVIVQNVQETLTETKNELKELRAGQQEIKTTLAKIEGHVKPA